MEKVKGTTINQGAKMPQLLNLDYGFAAFIIYSKKKFNYYLVYLDI